MDDRDQQGSYATLQQYTTVRSAFLTEHVINVWNSLSCDSLDFSSPKSVFNLLKNTS